MSKNLLINLLNHHLFARRLPVVSVINCGMKAWAVDTLRLMKDRNRNFDAIYHKKRRRNEWQAWYLWIGFLFTLIFDNIVVLF